MEGMDWQEKQVLSVVLRTPKVFVHYTQGMHAVGRADTDPVCKSSDGRGRRPDTRGSGPGAAPRIHTTEKPIA